MPKVLGAIANEQSAGVGGDSQILSLFGFDIGGLLITAAAGFAMRALGTLFSKNPQKGFATTARDPVGPWKYCYGQCRVGGTIVYLNTWPKPGGGAGGNDQMIDLVIVLAAHQIESLDAVLFDMQRVPIDSSAIVTTPQSGSGSMSAGPNPGGGTSYTPVQENINLSSIQRVNGVVTVQTDSALNIIPGDRVTIAEDGPGLLTSNDLIGTFQVEQIIFQGSYTIFTYLCGGTNCSVSGHGHVVTNFPDYGRTVYVEPMLGGQTLGQTFQGMCFGTPLDGNMGDIVTPSHTGGVTGQDQPNPWPSSADGVPNNASLVGKAAVMIRLHYNAQYYTGGLPQISFLIHGKNDIYDPRTTTSGYSNNAALCIADFASTPRKFGGFGLSYGTQIPSAELIAAANVCDEQVALAYSPSSPPLTEAAYACDGQFDLNMTRGEILQNMLTSCAGRMTFVAGQFVIWPGAWIGNAFAIGSNPGGGVVPIGDFAQLAAGPIRWRPTSPSRELYNGCKGTYISMSNKWTVTDFPPYCQDEDHGYGPGGLTPAGSSAFDYDASLEADGGDRRWLEIQLPFTISASRAQRIAKIEYLRRRNPGVSRTRGDGTLILNLAAYQIATLDLGLITLPYLGWSAKQIEVTGTRLQLREGSKDNAPVLSVEVDIQETDPTIYDWDTLEELSPAGYTQTVIPGVGTFEFFATEVVPGYTIPYPWKPGFISPLKGDAFLPGPIVSGMNEGLATFGLQARYGTANGLPATFLDISGTVPPSQLSDQIFGVPQITVTIGTSGSLPPGNYVVAVSAFDDVDGSPSGLSTPQKVVIPSGNNGSISISILWPPGTANSGNLGEVFMGVNDTDEGLSSQGAATSGTFVITEFDQATPGPPDGSFDHLAIAFKKEINGGPWAQQVQAVTPTTITIGGPGITANELYGRVLSLLGKLDSTQPLIMLNMPIASNTASATATYNGVTGDFFTVTIGPNSHGDQLPDLTTLLEVGDLLVLRAKGTYTPSSVSDLMFANPYDPTGLDHNTEPGHLIIITGGQDAGDVQTIESLSTDINGNWTTLNIAGQWAVTPNPGDPFIVVEGSWGPEQHTQPTAAAAGVASIVASPQITNLAGQVWVVIVRTQNSNDDNGDDQFAPIREIYDFGSQGTRTVRTSQTLLVTDRIILADASAGAITLTIPPLSSISNQGLYIAKVDSSPNVVTLLPSSGDTLGTKTSRTLTKEGANIWITVPGAG